MIYFPIFLFYLYFFLLSESMRVANVRKRLEGAIGEVGFILFYFISFWFNRLIILFFFSMNRALRSKDRRAMQACREHKTLQVRLLVLTIWFTISYIILCYVKWNVLILCGIFGWILYGISIKFWDMILLSFFFGSMNYLYKGFMILLFKYI